MNLKKKDYISISVIALVLVGSIILFFSPSLVGYNKSFVDIADKKEQIATNNSKMKTNESNIESLKATLDQLADESLSKDELADEKENAIDGEKFDLDIPSFLITMEQEAVAKNVKLNIDYSSMKTLVDASGSMPSETEQTDNQSQGSQQPQNSQTSSQAQDSSQTQQNQDPNQASTNVTQSDNTNSKNEQTQSTNEQTQNSQDTAAKPGDTNSKTVTSVTTNSNEEGTVISIPGMSTTSIPIKIEGTYANTRAYIKFLDKIGLIVPTKVELNSKGKKVVTNVTLNIIHGEVER